MERAWGQDYVLLCIYLVHSARTYIGASQYARIERYLDLEAVTSYALIFVDTTMIRLVWSGPACFLAASSSDSRAAN